MADAGDLPVQEHFTAAMQKLGLAPKQPLAVAFSGGGDSTALLALACAYAQGAPVAALIVDHGLRPESEAEARRAAATATALGARAHILCWQKPQAGQARARTARYRLLAGACKEAKIAHLLVAHTRDDQEETFVLRLARASSARGLACMSTLAPLPAWPEGRGLWLARPLLGLGRLPLRNWLRGQGLAWIEDPSNQDRRYARVRVRARLAALYAHGLPAGRLGASVRILGALEDARRCRAAALMAQCVSWHDAGYARIAAARFVEATADMRQRVLAAVLAGVAGRGDRPVPIKTLFKVVAKAENLLRGAGGSAFCVAGCRVQRTGATLLVSRDPGAVLGRGSSPRPQRAVLSRGQTVVFDNRFLMDGPEGVYVQALGRVETPTLSEAQGARWLALPVAVRPTVPVLQYPADKLTWPVFGAPGARFLGEHIAGRVLARFSL